MTLDNTSCIQIVPIFNQLPDELMQKTITKAHNKVFKRGEFIYHAGDINQNVYIINYGQVRIYRLTESGKMQVLRVLTPGDFTGEQIIFEEEFEQEYYAEVMRETKVCIFRREDLIDLIAEEPKFATHLLSALSQRLLATERQATQLSSESVRDRVIYYLESLVDPIQEEPYIVPLPMLRKDIASYLGTTPETISRRFKELEEERLIEQMPKNTVKIMDLDKLIFATDE